MPGASIKVVGAFNGTSTNLDGEYSFFTSLDKFEIEVHYLRSRTKKISVEIAAGETKILNIDLEPDATALDEIIVRGSLDGQKKALSQQKASDNLKNIISSDQMGKFPDQNSAESLQRVSGINVQRNEGDGRFVLVLGLAPQFTNISTTTSCRSKNIYFLSTLLQVLIGNSLDEAIKRNKEFTDNNNLINSKLSYFQLICNTENLKPDLSAMNDEKLALEFQRINHFMNYEIIFTLEFILGHEIFHFISECKERHKFEYDADLMGVFTY